MSSHLPVVYHSARDANSRKLIDYIKQLGLVNRFNYISVDEYMAKYDRLPSGIPPIPVVSLVQPNGSVNHYSGQKAADFVRALAQQIQVMQNTTPPRGGNSRDEISRQMGRDQLMRQMPTPTRQSSQPPTPQRGGRTTPQRAPGTPRTPQREGGPQMPSFGRAPQRAPIPQRGAPEDDSDSEEDDDDQPHAYSFRTGLRRGNRISRAVDYTQFKKRAQKGDDEMRQRGVDPEAYLEAVMKEAPKTNKDQNKYLAFHDMGNSRDLPRAKQAMGISVGGNSSSINVRSGSVGYSADQRRGNVEDFNAQTNEMREGRGEARQRHRRVKPPANLSKEELWGSVATGLYEQTHH